MHQIISELQQNTLSGAYSIWKKIRRYTSNKKIPEIRKKNQRANANGPPKKKRKKSKAEQFDDCVNPFHYLELLYPNKEPKYTCFCNYRIPNRISRPLDLSYFPTSVSHLSFTIDFKKKKRKFASSPPEKFDLSGLDHKYPPPTPILKNPRQIKRSGQISTEHQDRNKRFKK